jgi:hypothetical protein
VSTDLDEERAAIEARGAELAAKVPPLGPRAIADLARLAGSAEPDISRTEDPAAATRGNGSVTSGDGAMNPSGA